MGSPQVDEYVKWPIDRFCCLLFIRWTKIENAVGFDWPENEAESKQLASFILLHIILLCFFARFSIYIFRSFIFGSFFVLCTNASCICVLSPSSSFVIRQMSRTGTNKYTKSTRFFYLCFVVFAEEKIRWFGRSASTEWLLSLVAQKMLCTISKRINLFAVSTIDCVPKFPKRKNGRGDWNRKLCEWKKTLASFDTRLEISRVFSFNFFENFCISSTNNDMCKGILSLQRRKRTRMIEKWTNKRLSFCFPSKGNVFFFSFISFSIAAECEYDRESCNDDDGIEKIREKQTQRNKQ